MLTRIVLPVTIATAWLLLPQLAFALTLMNLLINLLLSGTHLQVVLQGFFGQLDDIPSSNCVKSAGRSPDWSPMFSIHVPAYDEPPQIVAQTLLSLSKLEYSNFEVIVLDNNTPDPAVYLPVKQLCATLGPRFRFFHFDGVEGAKAGALNLCFELMNPQAKLVAIVDADYQVEPHFLRAAVEHLQSKSVGFVQFPQAYRGSQVFGKEIACELNDYFSAFAKRANTTRSMLLTGTLSVIRADVLRKAGGWTCATITEDAELGARLFLQGIKGVFADEQVGTGLLPMSLQGLHAQRARWVAGNAQTLAGVIAACPSAPFRAGFASLVAQLTAWPTFWLAPALVLACATIAPPSEIWGERALQVAAVTIPLSAVLLALRLLASARLRGEMVSSVWTSLVVKLALVWTSSTAWTDGLVRRSLPFVRTPKIAALGSHVAIDSTWLAAIAGLAGMVVFALAGQFLAAVACILILATAPAALWTSKTLETYASAMETGKEQTS